MCCAKNRAAIFFFFGVPIFPATKPAWGRYDSLQEEFKVFVQIQIHIRTYRFLFIYSFGSFLSVLLYCCNTYIYNKII